jgi:hypothetical protein
MGADLQDTNTVVDLRQVYEWTIGDYKRHPKRLVVNPNWEFDPIIDVETWVQFVPAFVLTGGRIAGADKSFNHRLGQKAYLSGWDRIHGHCVISATWAARSDLDESDHALRHALSTQGAGYSMAHDTQVHRVVLSDKGHAAGLARCLAKDWFPWAKGFVIDERLLPKAENHLPRILREEYDVSTLHLS